MTLHVESDSGGHLLAAATNAYTATELAEQDLILADGASSVADARRLFDEHRIDIAPLRDERITHAVSRDALELADDDDARVAAVASPLGTGDLITGTTPLVAVLQRLRDRPALFVLDHDHVSGIITRSDLQRPSVAICVLTLILAIESGLNDLIRDLAGGDWITHLADEERRAEVEKVHSQRRQTNADIDLVYALGFPERLKIAASCPQIRHALRLSRGELDAHRFQLGQLRNSLAHGSDLLVHEPDADRGLDHVLRAHHLAVTVVERCRRVAAEQGTRVEIETTTGEGPVLISVGDLVPDQLRTWAGESAIIVVPATKATRRAIEKRVSPKSCRQAALVNDRTSDTSDAIAVFGLPHGAVDEMATWANTEVVFELTDTAKPRWLPPPH